MMGKVGEEVCVTKSESCDQNFLLLAVCLSCWCGAYTEKTVNGAAAAEKSACMMRSL